MLPECSAPDNVASGFGDQKVLRPAATGATSWAMAEASPEPGGGARFSTSSLRKQLVMDLHSHFLELKLLTRQDHSHFLEAGPGFP